MESNDNENEPIIGPQKKSEKDKGKTIISDWTKITIHKITLSNLIKVHRFVKNHPWVKASYGTSYNWIAEYIEHEDGTNAIWSELNWVIFLEKQENNRNDFVLTICSRDLILGRYILSKEDIANIPQTSTGFFAVSGDIISGLGSVGKIEMLCHREFVSTKPKTQNNTKEIFKPTLSNTLTQKSFISFDNLSPTKSEMMIGNENNSQLNIPSVNRILVRLLSLAAMDLKSVHFLEANSPWITLESGRSFYSTDPIHAAGMAARWNNLIWKFEVTRDVGAILTVNSNASIIGKAYFSIEELLESHTDENNVVQIIKHISDGKGITGKIKLNLMINQPQDYLTPIPGVSAALSVIEGGNFDNDEDYQKSLALAGKIRLPFSIIVLEITALDIVIPSLQQLLLISSLKIHCACGSWASATHDIKTKSKFGHWIDLKWKIPVLEDNNSLRITLWANGYNLGSSSLTVNELLDMPTDGSGRTEILTNLLNKKREATSRIRFVCRYEQRNSKYNDDKNLPPLPALNSSAITSPIKLPMEGPIHEDDLTFAGRSSIENLQFPILSSLLSISLVDLVSVHPLTKNSPMVRFTCDRKTANTLVSTLTGITARWDDLKWSMKIREDSVINIVVTSGNVTIGRADIDPLSLIALPLSSEGRCEINVTLKKNAATTGKALLTFYLKPYDMGLDAQESDMLNIKSTEQPSIVEQSASIHFKPSSSPKNGNYPLFSPNNQPTSGSSFSVPFGTRRSMFDLPNQMQPLNNPIIPENENIYNPQEIPKESSVIFDPSLINQVSLGNYHFKITVDEIDLWDLISVHSWAKNSPKIAFACGKFTAYTEAKNLAGTSCFWTGLNWSCNIKDRLTIARVSVTSNSKTIGTAFFPIETLLQPPSDENGFKRVTTDILTEDRKIVGKAKMSFILEILKSQSIFVQPNFAYNMEDPSILSGNQNYLKNQNDFNVSIGHNDNASYTGNVVGGQGSIAEESTIYRPKVEFPCTFTFDEFIVMELLPSSTTTKITKLFPYVKIACDHFIDKTQPDQRGLELAQFGPLNWSFPVQFDSDITLSVLSYGSELGSIKFSIVELVEIPANTFGTREIVLFIFKNNLKSGKVIGRGRFSPLSEAYQDEHDLRKSQKNPAIFKSKKSNFREQSLGLEDSTFPSPYPSHIINQVDNGMEYAYDNISRVSLPPELNNNQSLGHYSGEDSLYSQSLSQPPNVQQQDDYYGISNLSQSQSQLDYNSIPDLPNPSTRLNLSSVKQMKASTKGNGMGTPSSRFLPNLSVGSPQFSVDNPYGTSSKLFGSDKVEGNLKVFVYAIAAIDLPSIHTFAANSPSCSLACGRFTITAPIIPNAGASAVWEGLTWEFLFEKTCTMRIVVQSKDKTIGHCTFGRLKLLNGKRTQGGNLVLYGEMKNDEGMSTGNVKMVYDIANEVFNPQ